LGALVIKWLPDSGAVCIHHRKSSIKRYYCQKLACWFEDPLSCMKPGDFEDRAMSSLNSRLLLEVWRQNKVHI
jgi:hypothetical protein